MNRKHALIGATAVVAVLIVLGAGIFITVVSQDDATDTINPGSPAPTTSSAAMPGTVSSDQLGRPVFIPEHPGGTPLPQRPPSGSRQDCASTAPAVTSPEGVTIQRTYGTPSLLSQTDGPSDLDEDVLVGYSRTAQGAALAGWNFTSRISAGGQHTVDVFERMADVAAGDTRTMPSDSIGLGEYLVAPSAFRILSCSDSFVTVEYALPLPEDARGVSTDSLWTTFRLSLVWRHNDWKALFDDRPAAGGGVIDSLGEQWSQWSI